MGKLAITVCESLRRLKRLFTDNSGFPMEKDYKTAILSVLRETFRYLIYTIVAQFLKGCPTVAMAIVQYFEKTLQKLNFCIPNMYTSKICFFAFLTLSLLWGSPLTSKIDWR